LPNPNIVAAAIYQLHREVPTYNWGRFPPNANLEHYIIDNCAVLGNDLIKYFRLLRNLPSLRWLGILSAHQMLSLQDQAILELIIMCCDS
jgi:hypothetical protein